VRTSDWILDKGPKLALYSRRALLLGLNFITVVSLHGTS
jgi:hypothetical protein